jgi:hypothetical protein
MSTEYRDPFYLIVVGRPRSGKSRWVQENIVKHRDADPRTLVIPANEADASVTWAGLPALPVKGDYEPDELDPKGRDQRIVFSPDMLTFRRPSLLHVVEDQRRFEAVYHPKRGMRNGVLVLDDMKNYIKSNAELPSRVATMFRSRGHLMLDIVCIVHSFDEINRQLLAWGPKLVVFATDLPPGDAAREKIRNIDELDLTIDRVNRIANSGSNPYYHEFFTPQTIGE